MRLRIPLLFIVLLAPAARAGISMTMEPVAPGSADVRVRWQADTPGPFTLLRWTGACPILRPPSAIPFPLDPVTDVHATGLSGGEWILRDELTDACPSGAWIYQIVDAGGNCSNAGIVRWGWHERNPFPATRSEEYLALPARGAYPDAASFMASQPACQAVWLESDGECRLRRVWRRADGTLDGPNFLLPRGAGVDVSWGSASSSVVIGAAEGDVRLEVPLASSAGCVPLFRALVSLPVIPVMEQSNEPLCGREGVDWRDDDGNGSPDTCPNGIFADTPDDTAMIQAPWVRAVPDHYGRIVRYFAGQLMFSGLTTDLEPLEGMRLHASTPGRVVVGERGDPAACQCADGDGDGDDDCSERLFGTDPADPTSHGRDTDRDGVPDPVDPCPAVPDAGDADSDGDGAFDACDPCPADAGDACIDRDADGSDDGIDNCPDDYNPRQDDGDDDDVGDDCDGCRPGPQSGIDPDGDGFEASCDPCPDDPPVPASTEGGPMVVSREGGHLVLSLPAEATAIDVASGDLAMLRRERSFVPARCAGTSRWRADVEVPMPVVDAWFLVRRRTGCSLDTFGRGDGPERARLDDTTVFACP